jgi:choline dehydrogenase-like flavoprotein
MPTGAAWLSSGVESLRRQLKSTRSLSSDCDLLVIGSGYGGAVAAARLAGRLVDGRRAEVFVIERGREWLPGLFPTRFADLAGAVRFSLQDGSAPRGEVDGLYDVRIGEDVNLLLASGLGGGSLINAAVMERPDATTLASVWPEEASTAQREAAYQRAERMLQATPYEPPGGKRPPKLRALDALAGAAGSAGGQAALARVAVSFSEAPTQAGVPRSPCKQCGDCVTGCNWHAKNSLDTNYLAVASRHGARLFTGTLALRLERAQAPGEGWVVHCVPTRLPAATRADEAALTVRARHVIVAAGALGSTELLLRSASPALRFSERLGERFSANGDAIFAVTGHALPTNVNADEATSPEQRGVGPTITGLVRLAGETPFVVEEFGIPAALRRVLAEITGTFRLFHQQQSAPPVPGMQGEDPLAVGDNALAHTMVYGALGDDGAGGRLLLAAQGAGPWDGTVRVDGRALRAHHLFANQHRQLKALHASSASLQGTVVPNPAWRPLSEELADLEHVPDGPLATVHPLGGCALGADASVAVVDGCGRVFDPAAGVRGLHAGLAVLDGSIVNGALGINPALTIAALAEHAIERLAADFGFGPEPPLPLGAYAQAVWSVPSTRPVAPTRTLLSELVKGPITVQGHSYWAELSIDFAPVEDLLAFVVRHPHVMCTTRAVLRLFEPREREDSLDFAEDDAHVGAAPVSLGEIQLDGDLRVLSIQSSSSRTLDYRLSVTAVRGAGIAIQPGQSLIGTKTIDDEGPSLWRQLSVMTLAWKQAEDADPLDLGRLEVDLADFARREAAVMQVVGQQDAPSALAHVGALLFLFLRTLLTLQSDQLLGVGDQPSQVQTRKPGPLQGLRHEWFELRSVDHAQGGLGLTRYESHAGATAAARPVLMFHGLGAGGSTFAHASIPLNLVEALCAAGRVAWVAELRTSIAFDKAHLRDWTLEQVAEDVAVALACVQSRSGGARVDVVAHCIGAAVFSLAALGDPSLGRERVGAAVFSQVAPVVRLSAMNRFRGFAASYLQQYLGVETLDTRPDGAGVRQRLTDLVVNTFPYPEDDREQQRLDAIAANLPAGVPLPDFRQVRHRADAIFGQLMQLWNVGDETLAALDALFGPVRVKSLAQTIHYARWGLLADETGRNRVVSHRKVAEGMAFPLLLVHGRENRVFDWRGSRQALRLFRSVFGGDPGVDGTSDGHLHLGQGSPRQLIVLNDYGHQDTFIGKDAGAEIFPKLIRFLDEQAADHTAPQERLPPLIARPPWVGPAMGVLEWLPARQEDDVAELGLRMQLQGSPTHSRTLAVALVSRPAGRVDDVVVQAFFCQEEDGELTDLTSWLRSSVVPLRLRIDPDGLEGCRPGEPLLALMIHDDLPAFLRIERKLPATDRLPEEFVEAMRDFVRTATSEDLERATLVIDPALLEAADAALDAPPTESICMAVASCQYPPGLLDASVAQAAYRSLQNRIGDEQRPRPQLLLLLGDQVYVDATAGLFDPALDERVVDRAYELVRQMPAQRWVFARLPVAHLIDDHEIANDWQPRVPETPAVQRGLDAYAAWQSCLNPLPLRPDSRSCRFAPGGWPVFMLDTRTRRELRGPAGTHVQEARLIDPADFQALAEWLASQPRERVKFIATASVLVPPERFAAQLGVEERLGCDSGTGYPRTLLDLLLLFRDGKFENVVLLAGDAHYSLAASLAIDGGPVVHSVVSSGLHAPWPFANTRAEDLVIDGPLALSDGRRTVTGRITCHAHHGSGGFAIVRASGGDAPFIDVELHENAPQVRVVTVTLKDR